MIPLIPQRPQQIQQSRPSILPLLAHRLDEVLAEGLEEIAVADFGRPVLERDEGWGGRVTLFFLEVVGDVAEEVEALFGGPEEGVGHYFAGGGPAFGFLGEHGGDEVFGFVAEVAEDF